MSRPIKEFKVYPDNKSLFCKVLIFETKQDMYNSDWSQNTPHDFDARFVSIDHYVFKDGKERKTGFMGILTFHKNKCGGGVVSHEMTHAALAWFRRKKMVFDHLNRAEYDKDEPDPKLLEIEDETEEQFAWVLGNLVSQFYDKYYDTREDY